MNGRMLAAFAGVGWGLWPLIMSRAGLPPIPTAVIFSTCTSLCIWSAAYFGEWRGVRASQIGLGIIAGICAGSATLAFTRIVGTSPPKVTAEMFLLAIVVQSAVPVLFLLANGISLRQVAGIAAAILAIVLLGQKA